MVDPSKTGIGSIMLPDNPPNVVLLQAKRQARALKRCVYVYGTRSNWVTTTDLNEPPADAAVWAVPANENDRERQNWGGQ